MYTGFINYVFKKQKKLKSHRFSLEHTYIQFFCDVYENKLIKLKIVFISLMKIFSNTHTLAYINILIQMYEKRKFSDLKKKRRKVMYLLENFKM